MGRFQPALYGGLFIGVLSSLPGIQAGNCCCCLWVVAGGVLTTYLMQPQGDQPPLAASDVVFAGLLAGIVGGVVAGLVDLALAPVVAPFQQKILAWSLSRLQDMPNLPAESRAQLEQAMQQPIQVSVAASVIRSMVFTPVAAVFSMLGALLGMAFFRPKAHAAPPVQG